MYKIYVDDICIYNDELMLEETAILDPVLTLADNNAGSLTLTLPPTNKGYNLIQRLTSRVKVLKEDVEYWAGRVISESFDFWNNRHITCEGELAYFNDSIQPPAEYHNLPIRDVLDGFLRVHNSKVGEDKQFEIGDVTVTDPNDSIWRYTNFETTIECINDKLVKKLGGHLRVRKHDGVRYLDYLADYNDENTQIIEFGKNLLDFTKSFDMSEYATVIVPKGAMLEESPIEALEAYLTVESVNNGSIYVVSNAAVNTYGWIEKVVSWENVTVASNLLRKAKQYLEDLQFDNMVIELNAIDLHYLNTDIHSVSLLDRIRVISKPHGLNKVFPVTKLTIPLDKPDETVYTLGSSFNQSLTQSTHKAAIDIQEQIEQKPTAQSVLNKAKQTATTLMNAAVNGYVTIAQGADGTESLYISENPDYKKSMKLWKWNLNGLAYSEDGGKTYKTAITMDGSIVADFVTTGTMTADHIRGGRLVIGGKDLGSDGSILGLDGNGKTIFQLSKDGGMFLGDVSAATLSGSAGDTVKRAINDANEAIELANEAIERVDSLASRADSTASSAKSAAANAQRSADNASDAAYYAQKSADDAQDTADRAQQYAMNAQSSADDALASANAAQNSADVAKSAADTAQRAANTAQSTATKAKSTADDAKSTADTLNFRLYNVPEGINPTYINVTSASGTRVKVWGWINED